MNQRIKTIADAATLLFLRQGYAKTQMSHIARAAGVSVGSLYLDFNGKKEIMQFILKSTISPDFMFQGFERPITEELFTGLENEIVTLFERLQRDFAKNLETNAEHYSFKALISDAFDLLAQYAVGCLFSEKNYFDFSGLSTHYREYRRQFFETMKRYVTLFMEQGTVRPLEHLDLSVLAIIESLSWWAMDMRYTTFETSDIPLELAKEICLDNILTAYQSRA